MRRTLLVTCLVGAAVLAGCGTDAADDGATPAPTSLLEEPTSPEETETTPGEQGVAAMTFTDCEAERYTVGYPEGWNTNDPEGQLDACQLFHPGDIDVPEEARDLDLDYAVTIYIDAVAFADVRDADNPNEVLEQRETTVDGREALVTEYRSTGEALVPEGERGYTYIVDLDGEILVADTYSVGDTDYERDKEILDRMITEELTIEG